MGLLAIAEEYHLGVGHETAVAPEYRRIFVEESAEQLEEWESALLKLEQHPNDATLVDQIFRAVHTLKGSAGFLGFDEFQHLAHDLESVLQDVRDGAVDLTAELIDALFEGLDLCRRMIGSFEAGEEFSEGTGAFLERLNPPARDTSSDLTGLQTKVRQGNLTAPGMRQLRLRLHVTAPGNEAYLRAFLVRNRLGSVATILKEDPAPETRKDAGGEFTYVIAVVTEATESSLRAALNIDQLEILSIEEDVVGGAREDNSQGDAAPKRTHPSTSSSLGDEVVRVSVERLDNLLNLVGELVIQNSGFASVTEALKSLYSQNRLVADLDGKSENLAKITRDLQDSIMKIRMLPMHNVFDRFNRVVRDLAKTRGKEVILDIFGGETEIDKKVMDRINEPLVHLVRNAVDHGIEPRDRRVALGKGPAGLLRLGAYQEGDHICIEVSDDGKGLDRDAILAKAVGNGLLAQDAAQTVTDEKILDLIFLPGFSTAGKITEISGRGVGMDAVKRAIETLGGTVRVRSLPGRGTTVTVSLPLTMAIIPAVLVTVGDLDLAVPLSAVSEVLKVPESEMKTIGGRRVIRLREQVLAMTPLSEALSLRRLNGTCGRGDRLSVVIVHYDGKQIGLAVDRVIGTREIVIKSLSRHYREIDGLIGASILGNGRIALIVDVEAVVREHYYAQGDGDGANANDAVGQPPGVSAEDSIAWNDAAEAVSPDEEVSAEDFARALEAVNSTGALQASIAVSQMLNHDVRVSFPESALLRLAEIPEMFSGAETEIGGIYVGIRGELSGGILLVLPKEKMEQLRVALHRSVAKEPGAEVSDPSALSELANILSASFINALADSAGLVLKSEQPELTVDMCQSVIDSVLARFSRTGDTIVATTALLYLDESDQVVCHLLMFLDPESMHVVMRKLAPVVS